MEEYKGIYYGDDSEKKYFEGGAHFKYIKLYQRLEQIALEQKLKEKENKNKLYIHKNNKIKNILNDNKNFLDNNKKIKKSRNFLSHLDDIASESLSNYNKNKSFSNNVFMKYYQKKEINNENITNNNKKHQTYILIKNKNNKPKDNSLGKTQSFAIKNQKKIIISRNKIPYIIYKVRPNTILKEGIQNIFFCGKNNYLSNSMVQRKKNKKALAESLNKKSFSNINNLILEKMQNRIKNNKSYLEMNKFREKTDRKLASNQGEKLNKSQNNFNQIKLRVNSTNAKKSKQKIKKKNYIMNNNKKIKEMTKINLTNFIYKNYIEQFNNKRDKETEEKKESIIKKQNLKKNPNINKKCILLNNTKFNISSITKTRINTNNQVKKIISKQNMTEKVDKKQFSNLNKNHIKTKSRNINVYLNEINNSTNLKTNNDYKSRNKLLINTSRDKNNDKYKTTSKIVLDKGRIINIKQNKKIIQKNKINKYSPISNKIINSNRDNNTNINNNDKNILNYNYVLNNIPLNKEKIFENINSNTNWSELRNKTLNINIINNTCIYIKPKQSKCCLKNQSRNERVKSGIQINYTQRPIIKKKKPIIKLEK